MYQAEGAGGGGGGVFITYHCDVLRVGCNSSNSRHSRADVRPMPKCCAPLPEQLAVRARNPPNAPAPAPWAGAPRGCGTAGMDDEVLRAAAHTSRQRCVGQHAAVRDCFVALSRLAWCQPPLRFAAPMQRTTPVARRARERRAHGAAGARPDSGVRLLSRRPQHAAEAGTARVRSLNAPPGSSKLHQCSLKAVQHTGGRQRRLFLRRRDSS